jgi:hypothetical protein
VNKNSLKNINFILKNSKKFPITVLFGKIYTKLESIVSNIERYLVLLIVMGIKQGHVKGHRSSTMFVYIFSNVYHFYKISRRKELIESEKRHLLDIKNFGLLSKYTIPLMFYKKFGYYIVKTEKKSPIFDDEEAFKVADEVLKVFRMYEIENEKADLKKFLEINLGIEIINKLCGNESNSICREQIDKLSQDTRIHLGPAHGDFHSRNILKDENNNYFLIDFDCFRKLNVQQFDAIYFVIEHLALKNSINWLSQLCLIIENRQQFTRHEHQLLSNFDANVRISLYFAFFLDRIGQESKYVKTVWDLQYMEILDTMNRFIQIIKEDKND